MKRWAWNKNKNNYQQLEDIQAKFKELEEVIIKVTGLKFPNLVEFKKLGLYDDVEKQFDAFNKKSQKKWI